jgi:hypothetical protein
MSDALSEARFEYSDLERRYRELEARYYALGEAVG